MIQKKIHIQFIILCLSCLTFCCCGNNKPERHYYQLKIGGHSAFVEIADSVQKRASGLMYREALSENHGMLFVYNKSQKMIFWMKNTHVPLSIAFIDEQGIISNIVQMEPYDGRPDYRLPSYASTKKVRFALEMPQGWFQKKNIQAGMKVIIPLEIKKQ